MNKNWQERCPLPPRRGRPAKQRILERFARILRNAFPLIITMLGVITVGGQGIIDFNTRVSSEGIFAPIYGLQQENSFVQLRGNATTNRGNQAYTGPLLGGTGYTAALFGGPRGITDESDPTFTA